MRAFTLARAERANQASLGSSVASDGDLNGDGYADLILGAPAFSNGQAGEGAAFIFHGGSSGIETGSVGLADHQIEGNAAAENLGIAVGHAGDVNGDGFGDVIVGSSDVNRAYVFLGSAAGVIDLNPTTANATLHGRQTSASDVSSALQVT